MWCRALLFTVIITYLICVLLSGIRKEELDVNLVKKLQQYNVNMDNKTYDGSYQKCLPKAALYFQEETKPIEVHNTNETTKTLYSDTPINTTLAMKYYKELQKQNNNWSPLSKIQKTFLNDSILKEDIIQRRIKTDHKSVIEEIRKNNQTDINSVKKDFNPNELLKAFEKIRNNRAARYIPKPNTKKVSEEPSPININFTFTQNNDEQKKIINSINIKQFNQLLSDLLLTQTVSTSSPTTNTKIIKLDNVSRQIERFLNMKSQSDNNSYYNNFQHFISHYNNDNITKSNSSERIQKDKDIISPNEDEWVKNNTTKYINHLLELEYPLITTPYSENTKIFDNIQSTSISDISEHMGEHTVYQLNNINNKPEPRNDNNFKNLITNDIIKYIAEKVKDLVLKDLQKDFLTVSMSSTSSTTTEKMSTNTLKEENTDVSKVIENFFNLYPQLRSMKTNSSKPRSNPTQRNLSNGKATQRIYNLPVKIIIPPIVSPDNSYGIRNMQQDMTPTLYKPHLTVVTPIPMLPMDLDKSDVITQFNVFNRNSQHAPAITIQTNSNEIPPLRIHVPKVLNPINQNIILTTKNPLAIFKRMRNGHINPKNIYFKEGNNNNERAVYFSSLKHLEPPEHNEDTKNKESYIDEFKIKYYGDIDESLNRNSHGVYEDLTSHIQTRNKASQKLEQKNNHYEDEVFKPTYKTNNKEREHFQNENIKRFHEILERTDDWKSDSAEYMNERDFSRTPERQQRPMKDVEYPKYNDKHFQNFLKTQNKVNDMLERILATKTISDRPLSVELP